MLVRIPVRRGSQWLGTLPTRSPRPRSPTALMKTLPNTVCRPSTMAVHAAGAARLS